MGRYLTYLIINGNDVFSLIHIKKMESMAVLSDDVRSVKLILLLRKGGTLAAKKLVLNISDKSIDDILKDNEEELKCAWKKRHITEKQMNILFPGTSQPTDIECWDISLLSYNLLNLFRPKLKSDEIHAIEEVRSIRNDMAHLASFVMSEEQFVREWTRIRMVLFQLSRRLTPDQQKDINETADNILKIQDFKLATQQLEPFVGSHELLHQTITERLKSHEKKLTDYGKRLAKLESKVDMLLDIKARFTVDGSQSERDTAQAKLLYGFQRCVSDKKDQNNEQDHTSEQDQDNDDDEVLTDIKILFSDMEKQGVDIVNVEEGSILVTFRCPTTSALKNISKYIFDRMYEERLIKLENALSEFVKSPIKLNISIVLETLHAAIMQIEKDTKNKSIVLTLQCRGSEGVKNAIDCFGNGSSANTLNGLSEALTKYVGQKVELNTTIDVDKLGHDITELERQLILDDQNSEHELPKDDNSTEDYSVDDSVSVDDASVDDISEDDYVVEDYSVYDSVSVDNASVDDVSADDICLGITHKRQRQFDKLEYDTKVHKQQFILGDQKILHELPKRMESSLNLSTTKLLPDETAPTEVPMDTWTKLSSPYLSHTSPQLSKYDHKATLYRQQPFVVRPTTGLAFTTETCRIHYRHSFHRSDFKYWLKQTEIFSECEQVYGRRVTLKEIESCCPTDPFIELPCGCFKIRNYITAEVMGRVLTEKGSCYPEDDILSCATSKFDRHFRPNDPFNELICGCSKERYCKHIIAAEVLWTAGCVIDMAYLVGTGKLKNGIAFVPVLEWYGEKILPTYATLAAKQMKNKLKMKKILIFEWNSSNGVRTQCATYDDKAILYISIHDKIPWEWHPEHGYSHECGSQNAEGFNVNIQLNAFARDVEYLAAFRNIFMPIARDFNPEIVFVSSEFFDGLSLELYECFGYMIRELMSLASGKVVLLTEVNGRSFDKLAEICLKTFLGKEITPIKEDQYRPRIRTLQALEHTINIQLKYWPCLQSHLSTVQTLLFEAQKEENIRQDMTAVRYHSRTALSIDTKTCSEHGLRNYYSKDVDRFRLWMERNKLICDCELIGNHKATLQEIESYFYHSDVFHRPTMKLSELPCGCFEDATTRKRIPVDDLEAAGCVSNMAYMVGSGRHKNGLVFVPDSPRYFNIESDVFRLNFIEMAAEQLKEKLNMKRILIFQWISSYSEHRKIAQRANYDDEAILFISILDKKSMDPNQPQIAKRFNVNIVFEGLHQAEYMEAFRNIVMPIAREFKPEIVLASGEYCVATPKEYFGLITRDLMSLANGKVVLVLANVQSCAISQSKRTEMCLKALLGEDITPFEEYQLPRWSSSGSLRDLESNIQIQLKYWPCLQKHLSEIQTLLADDLQGGKYRSSLHLEEHTTSDAFNMERVPVRSLLGSEPDTIMVSSTDTRTAHDASEENDLTDKRLNRFEMKNEETSSV